MSDSPDAAFAASEYPPGIPAVWGDQISIEEIDGVPFRRYSPRVTQIQHLLVYGRRWGDATYMIQGDRTVTFAELLDLVPRKADELTALGVAPGDRVFILGWNSPDWVINLWAALWAGAVPVLVNAWWSGPEIAAAADALRPALVLADEHGAGKLPGGCRAAPWGTDADGGVQADRVPPTHGDENIPAVVIFTSGSAGAPKAVVLAHRSLLSGLHALQAVTRRLPQQLDQISGSIALHTGPLFHVGGMQTLLRSVVVGETLVFPDGKFDAHVALELIERYRITRWSAVPTMITRFMDAYRPGVHDIDSLRSLTVGGAAVHPTLWRRIHSELPMVKARAVTGYGLTENGGQATAATGRDTQERPGTVGRPLACAEIRIEAVPGESDGEILVRSPTQMLGYFGEEQSPIDAEGWLHTGDRGHLDADGYLWVTGRIKDLIIRGGENIAPLTVERAMAEIPGVVDSAVFALPHPDLGEEVAAVVQVTPEALEEPDLEARFVADLRDRLASFAVPSRWRFQTEPLPLLENGKVDKVAIAAAARRSAHA